MAITLRSRRRGRRRCSRRHARRRPLLLYDLTALTQAIDRLTGFLPYFDRLAEGLEDAVSESSRTLSQERALLVRLLTNLQAEYDRLQLY